MHHRGPSPPLDVEVHFMYERYVTQTDWLPWYVDRASLERWKEIRALHDMPPGFAGRWVGYRMRSAPRTIRDIHLAARAYSIYATEGDLDSALKTVDDGLAKLPQSSILHIERGKWLAFGSAGNRERRNEALRAWKQGLRLGCPSPVIALRLKNEMEFLKHLSPNSDYPPCDSRFFKFHRWLDRNLDRTRWSDAEISKTIAECAANDLGHQFLVHGAQRWFAYLIMRRYGIRFIVAPSLLSQSVTADKVLEKLHLVPRLINPRVPKPRWRTTKLRGATEVELRVRKWEQTRVCDTVEDLAGLYNACLIATSQERQYYLVSPIPDEGVSCLLLATHEQYSSLKRNRYFHLTTIFEA